jgi:hypothetical protein
MLRRGSSEMMARPPRREAVRGTLVRCADHVHPEAPPGFLPRRQISAADSNSVAARPSRKGVVQERSRVGVILKTKEVKLPCVTPWLTDRCFLPDLAGLSYLQLRRT